MAAPNWFSNAGSALSGWANKAAQNIYDMNERIKADQRNFVLRIPQYWGRRINDVRQGGLTQAFENAGTEMGNWGRQTFVDPAGKLAYGQNYVANPPSGVSQGEILRQNRQEAEKVPLPQETPELLPGGDQGMYPAAHPIPPQYRNRQPTTPQQPQTGGQVLRGPNPYLEAVRQHRIQMGVGGEGNAKNAEERRAYWANAARHQGTVQNRMAAQARLEGYANQDLQRQEASKEMGLDRASRETIAKESGVGAAKIKGEFDLAVKKATNPAELATAIGLAAKNMQGLSAKERYALKAKLAADIDKIASKQGLKAEEMEKLMGQLESAAGTSSPFDNNAMAILEQIDDPRAKAIVAAWRSKNATPTS